MEQQEQQALEAQLTEAAAEVLSAAMGAKAASPTPVRVQALALVLGRSGAHDTIATVQILDIEQRVPCLRMAVRKLNAHAFVFVYDGFITNGDRKIDALLSVMGTRWGTFTASATPYKHAGLGAVFEDTIDAPGAVEPYRSIFDAPVSTPA